MSDLASIIIIQPVIIPAESGPSGPVPWWFWLITIAAVLAVLGPVGWILYSDWKRDRGRKL